MRIGLVSDTHDNLCDWPAVCARVSAALDGERVAPVRATRNTDDPEPIPGRLDDGPIVIDADGAAIGVTFSLPDPRAARSVIGGLDAPLAVLEHEQVRCAARGDDLHAGLTPALVGGPPPLVEHPRP